MSSNESPRCEPLWEESDEWRMEVVFQNGNSAEHYPKIPQPSWRDHWCRMLKERGIDVPEYCEPNSSDQSK